MTQKKAFRRVLIANRGEIAVRIARTLREMEITPVAVYSDPDRASLHVRSCDLAYRLGSGSALESYLNIDKVLGVARAAEVDAIHPGYGFLSENADFAEAVEKAGLTFIGPPADSIRKMGSKTSARDIMRKAKVPCVPGSDGPVANEEQGLEVAKAMGYPIMLKASAGGGGKGMRRIDSPEQFASAFRAARSEAGNAFGDDSVYIEKLILQPRHIEIQIFSGPDGKTVWLGERECSMQRRNQKVIEETPSPIVDEKMRRAMGKVACRAAEAVNYVGAGTVEFLVDQDNNFYFLEMNTRLQVEHPVTELCCGLDLVSAQVKVASGEPLPWEQNEITRRGHAIEARIYAENPAQGFLPSPGRVDEIVWPQGPGVRVDAGVAAGFEVPRFYDPMIAKLVVWAETREGARRRMVRALDETSFSGLRTNTGFLKELCKLSSFSQGDYNTDTVLEALERKAEPPSASLIEIAIAATAVHTFRRDTRAARQTGSNEAPRTSGWRSPAWRSRGG